MITYCVSLPEANDRREFIRSQDFGAPVWFVDAVKADRPSSSFSVEAACARSHAKVMARHLALHPGEPFLLLEDDAEIILHREFHQALEDPPLPGHVLSLGSAGTRAKGMPFQRTHAMLFGPLQKEDVAMYDHLVHERETFVEASYWRAFPGRVLIHPKTLVNFAPFVSARTRQKQVPLCCDPHATSPVTS